MVIFFPKERLGELEKWNSIFFPFKYGVGIQKFKIPRILSLFQSVPEMIGHCGSTGSVAFYVPDMDIYITGTVNQQAKPNVTFQTTIKIIQKLMWWNKELRKDTGYLREVQHSICMHWTKGKCFNLIKFGTYVIVYFLDSTHKCNKARGRKVSCAIWQE